MNDRRSARRFNAQQGTLRVHAAAEQAAGHKLVDFSYNSARFLAPNVFETEQELIFDLQTEGHHINALKGYVIRVENAAEFQSKYFVVIKFFPFSTLEKYNSLENYENLKSLITRMQNKDPDSSIS